MSCKAEGSPIITQSEFEYPVAIVSLVLSRGEGRTRSVGENGVWQLDSGRRVLGKEGGEYSFQSVFIR